MFDCLENIYCQMASWRIIDSTLEGSLVHHPEHILLILKEIY